MREYLSLKEKLLLDYIYTRYKNTIGVKFRIPINDYSDIGSEFANWREIESVLNCQMYFADPYCAWQKGTNENLNGLLREFYPKGHDLSRVSPKTLEKNLALINARPKKVLNFQKPKDLFELFLNKCCT